MNISPQFASKGVRESISGISIPDPTGLVPRPNVALDSSENIGVRGLPTILDQLNDLGVTTNLKVQKLTDLGATIVHV